VRLRTFYASDGDCLLLTSGDGHHVLIDGGRKGTFRDHTWPTLEQLSAAGEAIDLVVVSHVDDDHISGIAWLWEHIVAWRAFDYQHASGNDRVRRPELDRPPAVGGIWHNAWLDPRDSLGERVHALAQRADDLAASIPAADPDQIGRLRDLALGLETAADLRRLIDEGTDIPRNRPFRGEVRRKRRLHVESVGSMRLTVLGPSVTQLTELRTKWEDLLAAADASGAGIDQAAHDIVLGRIPQVTIENRASITILAEEDASDGTVTSCLLTGDADQASIIEGLRAAGRFGDDGTVRCDVVKVQHHGSEHNVDEAFAGQVVAGTYVLCADGAHSNPEPEVVRAIVDGRGNAGDAPFAVWFTCSPERTLLSRRAALAASIAEARKGARRHPHLTVRVLDDDASFFDLPI
jgi:beta-lactamase superfamily II metal-dependent hydrolase